MRICRGGIKGSTRVLGNVVIGDDVFIGPHCVIKEGVPSGSIVTVRSELQVIRQPVDRSRISSKSDQIYPQPIGAS